MITSKNVHFGNWSLRKRSLRKIGHLQNDHFKEWFTSRNDHFKKLVTSKTITFNDQSLRKIDHFENDRFEEWVKSKTTTSKKISLPKRSIWKIGNFRNSKIHLERDHFGIVTLRYLTSKEGHFENNWRLLLLTQAVPSIIIGHILTLKVTRRFYFLNNAVIIKNVYRFNSIKNTKKNASSGSMLNKASQESKILKKLFFVFEYWILKIVATFVSNKANFFEIGGKCPVSRVQEKHGSDWWDRKLEFVKIEKSMIAQSH